jgi:hypothetical protein
VPLASASSTTPTVSENHDTPTKYDESMDDEEDGDYIPSTEDEDAEYDESSVEMQSADNRDQDFPDEEIDDLLQDQEAYLSNSPNVQFHHLTNSPFITPRRETHSNDAAPTSIMADPLVPGSTPPTSN